MSWVEEGELFAESQGGFAPEQLNPKGGDDVFSRRFKSDTIWMDISAAPCIPQGALYSEGFDYDSYEGGYEVTVMSEKRDAGDEGGDTSNYEYEDVNDQLLPYDQAVRHARQYIENLNPERDFA